MTPDDVRAAAEQLVHFHERFAPLFGKEQAQDHAYRLHQGADGLPRAQEHRADRPAGRPRRRLGPAEVRRRRPLAVRRRAGRGPVPLRRRAGPLGGRLPGRGGRGRRRVGLHQEGDALRRGGPAAQRPARQGGQLPGRRLPGRGDPGRDRPCWTTSCSCPSRGARRPARRRTAGPRRHIPEGLPFRTKPRIAAELVRDVAVLGQVELDWVVADEEYGRAGHFLDELETLEQRYVVEVPVTTAVWTADPASCVPAYSGRGRVPTAPARDAVRTVARLAAELPASAWQALQVREGAIGPLVFEFAAVRVWAMRHRKPGPPAWLLIRRSLGAEPELKYYVSNADAETPLSTLALVACTRCRVEEFFEDCKSYLGHGAVRDAVVGRVAPPHDAGGAGAPVRDAGAEAASKKNAGADAGPDGAAAGGGVGGAGVEAAAGDGAGGLPRAAERGGQEVARQDVAGQTPGRQIPAAVELLIGLLAMESTPKLSRDEFIKQMREKMEAMLGQGRRRDQRGTRRGRSSRAARNRSATCSRTSAKHAFETGLQMRVDAAEAAFPPSEGPEHGQDEAQ